VCIYDSLPRSSIEPTLAAQAREWFPPEKAKIVFRVQKSQNQSGSFCGYFALAYAITKCLGENPDIMESSALVNFIFDIHYHNINKIYLYKQSIRFNFKFELINLFIVILMTWILIISIRI
jgi:hypothetical protein